MAEPPEVLLIKDQYKFAYHCLGRALAAEQAGRTEEALDYYRMGRQHFAHGVEVPTGAEWQQGAVWDTARQYQQRMRDSLHTVNAHLTDLATSQLTTADHRNQMLLHFSPPPVASNSQPHHTSLQSVCPTLPPRPQNTNLISPPPRPASCPPFEFAVPAEASGTTAMNNPGEQPPEYTPKPTNGHSSLAFGPTDPWSGSHSRPRQNEMELLFIPSGVQLFFVAPNGQVSSLSNPGYLRIVTFDSGTKEPTTDRPSAFLHVCDRLYQLTTDTPVLLANSGIFMFTDCSVEMHGSFVGIVLSSELPVACRELFKDLLSQLADLRFQSTQGAEADLTNLSTKVPVGPPQVPGQIVAPGEKSLLPRWSEKMAHGILSGSTWLGQGFLKGAEATSRAIHKGGFKMRDRMTPEETPSEVSHKVTKGLEASKQATGGVLRVSRFLVDGVSKVLGHAAEKVAPHVKKQGAKLVPESLKNRKEGEPSNWDGTKHVASSSVQGFSTVWSSLEEGAKLVGKSVRAETVTSVTYKYGNSAGDATDTALQSVVNVGVTAYNIDNLGIKAVLKTAGKQTAKAMVKSSNEEKTDTEGLEKQKEAKAQIKK
ncbi:spartin a isoform X1 [Cynoglossus semilaevis]|uniref:spartin a isoform X1 n=1 Tax=Cynoglossus semilaevis TaxID=244447 RepID=UPI0004981073|nr:spartin isoform X1 [Cynoglossus semilaevis]XP_008331088.1 spartin isoform X1 [Cynoglossus semilaevis]